MENHQENAEAASQIEEKPASIESNLENAGQDAARDPDVVKDEEEAMRRAKLPDPSNDPPEATNPQVAEIESIIAAIRH